jgi:hypothetical protein
MFLKNSGSVLFLVFGGFWTYESVLDIFPCFFDTRARRNPFWFWRKAYIQVTSKLKQPKQTQKHSKTLPRQV